MFDGEHIRELIYSMLFGLVAFVGGAIGHMSRSVTAGTKISLIDLFIKSISSGFAGLIIGWIMVYYQYPITIICSVTGCAGYIGAEVAIGIIRKFIEKKLDVRD